MISQRGSLDGIQNEKDWVILYNTQNNADVFKQYNINIGADDYSYMVHVDTTQLSTLSMRQVKTRADLFMISSRDNKIKDLLEKNSYYISDRMLLENHINFIPISQSGISVKMQDSRYQIIKLTPDSFYNLFNNYEVGALCSLYCSREEELFKNKNVLAGWKTNIQKIKSLVDFDLTDDFIYQKEQCQTLKAWANHLLQEQINKSVILKEKIFNGIGIYKEPYSAHYFLKDTCDKLNYIPFGVTTGSGRSRGDYTIVLKPK